MDMDDDPKRSALSSEAMEELLKPVPTVEV